MKDCKHGQKTSVKSSIIEFHGYLPSESDQMVNGQPAESHNSMSPLQMSHACFLDYACTS